MNSGGPRDIRDAGTRELDEDVITDLIERSSPEELAELVAKSRGYPL